MKPELELIEAVLLVYIQSEIKNVIIQHEAHAGTDFESYKEYKVFNKTLKEKDILKYYSTDNIYVAVSHSLHEFSWAEIRFIFLQYKFDGNPNLKLKLRPVSVSESDNSSQWLVYGRSIPFFTFTANTNKDAFIETFEEHLIEFLG
jgi:hypothetical protein